MYFYFFMMKFWPFMMMKFVLVLLLPVTCTQIDCKFNSEMNLTNTVVHIPLNRVGQNDLANSIGCVRRAKVALQKNHSIAEATVFLSAAMISIPRYARLFVLATAYEVPMSEIRSISFKTLVNLMFSPCASG